MIGLGRGRGPLAVRLRSHYSNFLSPEDKKEELEDSALS